MSSVSMTLGNYSFDPVPLLSISDQINRTESGQAISKTSSITINGELHAYSSGCQPNLGTILALQQELRDSITCSGCYPFIVSCVDGEDPVTLIDTYVRVNSLSINESNDNWVLSAPYQIQLEYTQYSGASGEGCYECLRSIQDNWSIQPSEQYAYIGLTGCNNSDIRYYNVIRDLQANGLDCCVNGVTTPGWEAAKDWVVSQLSGSPPDLASSVLDIPSLNSLTFLDHSRTISTDIYGGSYSVQESWVATLSGVPEGCLHDFTIEEQFQNSERFRSYSISGTLTGMEKRTEGFTLISTKMQSANECWSELEPDLTGMIECHINLTGCPLNPIPQSYSIARAPHAGTIQYNYTFTNRPTSLVPNALFESINFTDTKSSRIIARIPVLGRKAGPILHDTGTTNELTKSVSITVIMPAPLTCPGGNVCTRFDELEDSVLVAESGVDALLCCVETRLRDTFDKVYKIGDTNSYDIFTGSYQRDVSWNYQKCEAPIISPCGEDIEESPIPTGSG